MSDNADMRDDSIQHEGAVRDVVVDEVEETTGKNNAAIANAVVAHALNATFSDTEVEAALNALGVKVNAILAVLRGNGLVDV